MQELIVKQSELHFRKKKKKPYKARTDSRRRREGGKVSIIEIQVRA